MPRHAPALALWLPNLHEHGEPARHRGQSSRRDEHRRKHRAAAHSSEADGIFGFCFWKTLGRAQTRARPDGQDAGGEASPRPVRRGYEAGDQTMRKNYSHVFSSLERRDFRAAHHTLLGIFLFLVAWFPSIFAWDKPKERTVS